MCSPKNKKFRIPKARSELEQIKDLNIYEMVYDVFVRKRTDEEIKDYNDMMDLLDSLKGNEICNE